MALTGWNLAQVGAVGLLSVASLAAPNDPRLVNAVRQGDRGAVRALLAQQVDVNSSEADGATALMWAVHQEDLETVDLLIHAGANVNAANEYGATPSWLACSNGAAALVERLVQAGARPDAALLTGETPLLAAARTSVEAVESLLAHGADINAREPQGGQTALMRAVAEQRPDIAQVLIEKGADVNSRSKGGFTPLLFAVQQNSLESARNLVAAGANVNDASPDASPLLLAVSSGYQPLAIFLLENGGDPNAVDFNGHTSLHYAAARRNMLDTLKALLAKGANPNARITKAAAKSELIPIIGVPFLKSPARVVRDGTKGGTVPIGATPLWLAAEQGNAPAMRLLAAGGADPKLATTENVFLEGGSGRRVDYMAGTTPLMEAAGVGRVLGNWTEYSPEDESRHLEALKVALEELGGDVNAPNEYGYTPLHGAAYVGANTIIPYLVQKGAKMEVLDNFGQTPLSIAYHVITTELGDSLDARPRKYREDTANVLLQLGATPLEKSGVKVLDVLELHTPIEASR